jgi:hypothetical protein
LKGADTVSIASTQDVTSTIHRRVDRLDWKHLAHQLDTVGHAVTPVLLNEHECEQLSDLFDQGQFRSTVDMARHRFGDGRYRYFDLPLPEPIAALRSSFYPHLAPIANRWSDLLRGENPTFPLRHDELLARFPRYGDGDWNALHQDLYGKVFFPFQILTILSRRGVDFDDGEFVLLEQRPRAQSRAHVLTPDQGAFVIFPTAERPSRGANGYHRVGMRHGVASITSGQRTALGIIFHEAK